MDDDFNTREAVAVLFELAKAANAGSTDSAESGRLLRALGGVLGLLEEDAERRLQGGEWVTVPPQGQAAVVSQGSFGTSLTKAQVDELIEARTAARKTKDFAKGDQIRKELLDAGIVLEDSPQGTTWRRV